MEDISVIDFIKDNMQYTEVFKIMENFIDLNGSIIKQEPVFIGSNYDLDYWEEIRALKYNFVKPYLGITDFYITFSSLNRKEINISTILL